MCTGVALGVSLHQRDASRVEPAATVAQRRGRELAAFTAVTHNARSHGRVRPGSTLELRSVREDRLAATFPLGLIHRSVGPVYKLA